jgi:GT2 family glycosyltransferase
VTAEETTIAICTFRHGPELVETLRGAVAGAPDGVEVLIVRSGVSENEALPPQLAEWVAETSRSVRIECVPELGAARARQRALETGRELLLFLDDHVSVAPGWFDALHRELRRPEVGAAGGPIVVGWPSGRRPWWLPRRLAIYFGERRSRPEPDHMPFGPNMGLRRSAALEVGGLRRELGPIAARPGMHEETELCRRLAARGWEIAEVPDASVEHVVRPDQVRVGWVLRRAWQEGRADSIQDRLSGVRERRFPIRVFKLVRSVVLAVPSLLIPPAALYVAARLVVNLGYLTESSSADASANTIPR